MSIIPVQVVMLFYMQTSIRSVERGICPIAAVCTVLFYCPDYKALNIRVATLTLIEFTSG